MARRRYGCGLALRLRDDGVGRHGLELQVEGEAIPRRPATRAGHIEVLEHSQDNASALLAVTHCISGLYGFSAKCGANRCVPFCAELPPVAPK
jgi:hypothetical protein